MVRLAFDDVADYRWHKPNERKHVLWIKLANEEVHEVELTPKKGDQTKGHNRSA